VLINYATVKPTEHTTTVVFFLGGCTYTEIAALRWVGRQSTGESIRVVINVPSNVRKLMMRVFGMVNQDGNL
jgi:hypothetical protein